MKNSKSRFSSLRTAFLAVFAALSLSLKAVTAGDQDISVQFYSPRTVRVVKTPAGQVFSKPFTTCIARPGDVSVAFEDGDVATWRTDELVVKLDKSTRLVSFWTPDGRKIMGEKENAYFHRVEYGGKKAMRVNQCFWRNPAEGLYGLGDLEKSRLNQAGARARLEPRNVGDGIAYVASNAGWALWWDNTSPTDFQDRPGDLFYFESDIGEGVDYYFMWGASGDGCVAEMRALTGHVPMFPRWAYGFWQSKERYVSPDETIGVLERYRKDGIPLDGIVQDWQYWGGNEMWNAMDFTGRGWERGDWMIARAHELNAKMIITIWQSFGPATKQFKELSARGFLFPFSTWPMGKIGGEHVKLCDNYSSVVRDIYWRYLKRFWDAGIDGWWMDSTDPDHSYREGDYEWETAAGASFRAVRTAYPVSAVKGVYEHQRAETGRKRVFILTRGAGAGQQRFASTVWSGDVASNWDVLRSQIPGGLNYTVTGNPQFNCDLGGFFAGRYGRGLAGAENPCFRELYARWVQLGTFLPMMRSHGTDIPREIFLYGKPGEEIYDSLVGAIKLRYRLMPYIYSLAGHITKDGASFMRPLWFDYAADPATRDEPGEFLLGTEILAAPVLKAMYTAEDNTKVGEYEGWNNAGGAAKAEAGRAAPDNERFKGARAHRVYLPGGTDWYDFETGEKFPGGTEIERNVSMRSQPFYVKAGGILPLGPDVQFNGERDWSHLDINVYPGADGSFSFYEDAFDSYDYEKGMFTEIPMEWNEEKKTFTLGERKGAFPEMIARRKFTIRVASFEPREVEYDGHSVSICFK